MYKAQRNYENIQKALYEGVGSYRIPEIKPTHYDNCEWIGFNYAKSATDRECKGVHFFLDDYQFIRVWTNIDQYIPMLQQFKYVLTPDFSLYTDFPKALQVYNHYRKHWLGAYMQENGIEVIPTIGWSNEESFEWCFDGEPVGSCVAISSIGCMNNKQGRELFVSGYQEMLKRLKPKQIICYGKIPKECEGNIIAVKPYVEIMRKEMQNGR